MNYRRLSCAFLTMAGAAFLLPNSAEATVLISDTFSTSGALNGSTPGTTVGGASWTALGSGSGGPTSNGSVLSVPTSAAAQTDVLDLGANYFTAHPGIYTLSMDVTMAAGSSSSWIGLGFAVNPQTAGTFASTASGTGLNTNGGTNGGSPWMLDRQSGQVNVYRGAGTGSNLLTSGASAFPAGTTYTMKLVLDTSVTNWTLDAYMNSTQLDLNGAGIGNTAVFSTNPTDIRYVGFSQNGGNFGTITMDNFTLSVVPEPSSAALALCGVGLIYGVRRLRRVA